MDVLAKSSSFFFVMFVLTTAAPFWRETFRRSSAPDFRD